MNRKNFIRSLKVALFVGSILNLINNYHIFSGGDFSLTNNGKILFTYMVPFLVSFYSSWKTSKEN